MPRWATINEKPRFNTNQRVAKLNAPTRRSNRWTPAEEPSPNPPHQPTFVSESRTTSTHPTSSASHSKSEAQQPLNSSSSRAQPYTRVHSVASPSLAVNPLTSAIQNQQRSSVNHTNAEAAKRRKAAVAAGEWNDGVSKIDKFRYHGPDPRYTDSEARVDLCMNDGKGAMQDAVAAIPASAQAVGAAMADDDDIGEHADSEMTMVEDYPMTEFDPTVKDDAFDSIISSAKSKRSGIASSTLKPIIPFKQIVAKTAPRSSGSAPTKPTPASIKLARAPATTSQEPNRAVPVTQTPPPVHFLTQVPPAKTKQAQQARARAIQESSTTENQKSARSRGGFITNRAPQNGKKVVQQADEYGDDAFDALLAGATTFDDGQDIYTDAAFDTALEEALRSGTNFP